MSLKKKSFNANEIPIYDDAIVEKRGDYWQMRMWLTKERKYARFSLKTKNKDTALEKAKKHYIELMAQQLSGKTYFSKTTKQGVEEYLKQREKDVETEQIVKGRYSTIKTHLEHWLDFIGRDKKLKELERTDGEDYLHSRTMTKKKLNVSQSTVANEQSTINAMISWLFKRNETYIEAFDFPKIKKVDKGDEELRRSSFTEDEMKVVKTNLETYIKTSKAAINEKGNLVKFVTAYYLLISVLTGLRRGEQLQLRWCDIEWLEKNVKAKDKDDEKDKNKVKDKAKAKEEAEQNDELFSLVKIAVRYQTSKVRKTRNLVIKDWEHFDELFKVMQPRYLKANKDNKNATKFSESLIFSIDGKSQLSPRAIAYHFEKIIEISEIKNTDKRHLVPYSFRHYFITDMVNQGVSPHEVKERVGTSLVQIENTYYHNSIENMIKTALPRFDYKDGLLIPK